MSRTYRLSDFQPLLREQSDHSTSQRFDRSDTLNGIAAPAKARQWSARAETEVTLTEMIPTASALLIDIGIASTHYASRKSKPDLRIEYEDECRDIRRLDLEFWDSDDSMKELWHRNELWHSFGTVKVKGQNSWFRERGTWKCFIMNSALHVGA